jgi:hypothetical protein
VSGELLLVGSIPLDTPKDVFETFGPPLGRYLFAMPDGEVGPRRHWISRVHYQVLAAHPELEIVQRPAPDDNGVERQFPRGPADAWWFRVRSGVKQVRFGDPGWRLGYASVMPATKGNKIPRIKMTADRIAAKVAIQKMIGRVIML